MAKIFKKADLVRWYDYYEDQIVRDAGLGIVVEAVPTEYEWPIYNVFKLKTGTTERFEAYQLDEINPPVPER